VSRGGSGLVNGGSLSANSRGCAEGIGSGAGLTKGRDMILGMSIQTFTLVHTAISLIAILTGLIVVVGMLTGKRMPEWTGVFLLTTVLTSVTGFMFPVPISLLLPSQITGIVALAVLLPTLAAIYVFKLSGPWRSVYIIGAVISLYLNVFVLVAQAFVKVPALNALAPTQAEPPFAIAQGLLLFLFVVLGIVAAMKFRPAAALSA
jgi:hypothetical protein